MLVFPSRHTLLLLTYHLGDVLVVFEVEFLGIDQVQDIAPGLVDISIVVVLLSLEQVTEGLVEVSLSLDSIDLLLHLFGHGLHYSVQLTFDFGRFGNEGILELVLSSNQFLGV